MNNEQIEQHRAIYPLPVNKLCLYSSFEQILGKNDTEYTTEERKRRWNKVMKLNNDMEEHWNNTEACYGCKHLMTDAWCNMCELPCTVNPITSFKHGVTGMACMGFCYENKQLDLSNKETL